MRKIVYICIIVQEAVMQHEYINQFCDSSVNTLRLSLYKRIKDDKCHVTAAIMRIGKPQIGRK